MPLKKSSSYENLRDSFVKKHQTVQKNVWDKHGKILKNFITDTKQLALGSVGAMMLLSSPHTPLLPAPHDSNPVPKIGANPNQIGVDLDSSLFFLVDLQKNVPDEVRPLSSHEEASIGALLTTHYGMHIVPEIDGKRLHRSYGVIGAEQHLARYPGDTMESHFDSPEDAQKYWSSGMAPGLGAWRYFAHSRSELTEKEVMQEKYYIAVPTFLSKDFNSRASEYRDFFKFRKMLVVNPDNGKAVVAVIGDAGPATWTGKHLGGSPEVMKHLERVDGKQKGPVLYFFVDDPEDSVSLGPIEVKRQG